MHLFIIPSCNAEPREYSGVVKVILLAHVFGKALSPGTLCHALLDNEVGMAGDSVVHFLLSLFERLARHGSGSEYP
jgi:hypothetical protein